MTTIEWTDATWNPAVGCSRVSPGCEHCYAERFVHRGMQAAHRGLTVIRAGAPGWTGEVRFLPDRLAQPQRWRKPKRIFVNSLSDVFHERLSHEQRLAIFGAMCVAPQHIYQILTKRPEHALEFEWWLAEEGRRRRMTLREMALAAYLREIGDTTPLATFEARLPSHGHAWWIGVTAEDQRRADERIPKLLALHILPTLRFVSYEPALGPVVFQDQVGVRHPFHQGVPMDGLRAYLRPSKHAARDARVALDWIIVGGESGPGARPFEITWARSTIEQCRAARVPVFVKQLGARPLGAWEDVPRSVQPLHEAARGIPGRTFDMLLKDRKGGDQGEWPEDLRVRDVPSAGAVA